MAICPAAVCPVVVRGSGRMSAFDPSGTLQSRRRGFITPAMSDFDSDIPELDLTAKGIEFAPWHTEVESDDLVLAKVVFEEPSPLVTLGQGLSLSLPTPRGQDHILEATFISTNRQAV